MTDTPWLSYIRRDATARLRIFCLHPAGSGASFYRSWSHECPKSIELIAVQLPGREGRISEPCYTRLTPLLAAIATALHPYLTRPYALFGHSMGALVSYELACLLQRHGRLMPQRLFVSGHRAPQLPNLSPPIHAWPERHFMVKLRALANIPEAVLHSEELLALLLPVLRADFAVCEDYRYVESERLRCPISVFSGTDDSSVPNETALLWQERTSAEFTFHPVSGDHFFVQSKHAQILEIMRSELSID